MESQWIEVNNQLSRHGRTVSREDLVVHRDAIRADLPHLRFGRRVLTPALVVEGHFPSSLHWRLVVHGNSEAIAIESGQSHVILNKTILELDSAQMVRINEILTEVGVVERSLSGSQFLQLRTFVGHESWFSDNSQVSGSLTHETEEISLVPVHEVLSVNPYPYQEVGIRALLRLARGRTGALLCDHMGLGKTLQAIALLAASKDKGQHLVVCPASLLENWCRELNKFAPTLTVALHHGPKRLALKDYFPTTNVVLTTYETVSSDIAYLSDLNFSIVVLDEAQQVKNPDSVRSQAVKRLRYEMGVIVTGTPVENSLRDLWSLSEFSVPGLLGGFNRFCSEFPDDVEAARRLGEIVDAITIRRTVEEVADDLPEITHIHTVFDLPTADRIRYDVIQSSGVAFEVNTRLLVLTAHADLDVIDFESKPKNDFLIMALNEIFERNQKALIFAPYRESLARLKSLIQSTFPAGYAEILDGQVSVESRQLIVDKFSEFDGSGALLINPRAGGVGLNITTANHVFHYAPGYNPALTKQATARSFRRGQLLPVFVHYLYYRETVEEKAVDISDFKNLLATSLDTGLGS